MSSYTVTVGCVATVYNVQAETEEEAVNKAAHQIENGTHPDNMSIQTREWDEDNYEVIYEED